MASSAAGNPVRAAGGQQGQLVDLSKQADPPVLTQPLINEPMQANPMVDLEGYGPLAHLIGTWTNQNLGSSGLGGTENPFSYNLMVLPQVDKQDPTQSPNGYILKSMSYYEELTFSPIHGTAANRSGTGTQVSNALLYEQRVYISQGPAEDMLVHFENGILANLTDRPQMLGPYGNGNLPGLGMRFIPGSTAPTQPYSLFKQISVPHGNSVLACGNPTPGTGAPTIGPPPQVLPTGIDTSLYHVANYVGNLNPKWGLNPNAPLAQALEVGEEVVSFIQLDVDSALGGGNVTNIAFEQASADVMQYSATYWLEQLQGSEGYQQLQYSQTIMLRIPIMTDGVLKYVLFPHITTNTLTKTG